MIHWREIKLYFKVTNFRRKNRDLHGRWCESYIGYIDASEALLIYGLQLEDAGALPQCIHPAGSPMHALQFHNLCF